MRFHCIKLYLIAVINYSLSNLSSVMLRYKLKKWKIFALCVESHSIRLQLESVTFCNNDNWTINFAVHGITSSELSFWAHTFDSMRIEQPFYRRFALHLLSSIIYLFGALIWESQEEKKKNVGSSAVKQQCTDCRYCIFNIRCEYSTLLRDEIDTL